MVHIKKKKILPRAQVGTKIQWPGSVAKKKKKEMKRGLLLQIWLDLKKIMRILKTN